VRFGVGHPLHSARIAAELLTRRHRRALAFHIESIGEAQYLLPIMRAWAAAHPGDVLVVAHGKETWHEFDRLAPDLGGRVRHVAWRQLEAGLLPGLDVLVSSSRTGTGPRGLFAVAIADGQPCKGATFSQETLAGFDALFLNGPLHRQALDEFSARNPTLQHGHLRLLDVGFPKSDEVLRGTFDRSEVLSALGLDPAMKCVLYAPAPDDGASMREAGEEIVRSLAAPRRYSVVVTLPANGGQPGPDLDAGASLDWLDRFSRLERTCPHVVLAREPRIDPLLAAADVLVTCVSGASFEMLALGKPVVFFDSPEFFGRCLRGRFPGENTAAWAERTTVNAGREFGPLVKHPEDLPGVIEDVLARPETYPLQRERLRTYLLYNPGRATEAALRQLEAILAERPRSRRPRSSGTAAGALGREAARFGREVLVRPFRRAVSRALYARGLMIAPVGSGYIDAAHTAAAARAAGLSLCEYLEGRESDPRRRGRRDRIITRLESADVLRPCDRIVEIGAGTGMYLERVVACARPSHYEAYEADQGWAEHLRRTYGADVHCRVVVHPADGETLGYTPSASCGLVHAHGVLVYIPSLRSFSYLAEAARVLAPGGHLVFDALLDVDFGSEVVDAWLRGPWRFPVVLPERLVLERAGAHGLELVDRFPELYGSSTSEYLIFRKRPQEAAPASSGE
jgi:SAM-dependent methyltransferase